MENKKKSSNIRSPKSDKGSPPWIKPCEVMRLHKKAKRQLQMQNNVLQSVDTNIIAQLNSKQKSAIEKKCMNPFRKSPKKEKLSKNNENSPTKQTLLNNWITKVKSLEHVKKHMSVYESYLPTLSPSSLSIPVDILDDTTNITPPEIQTDSDHSVNKNERKIQWKSDIPLDWSLKTKVRFMSVKPFPWRGNLKTAEEASGTTSYTRCLQLEEKEVENCVLDSSPGARFYHNCLYWMHPSLPWLHLFPRMDTKGHLKKTLQTSVILSDNIIQDSLHSDWCESFRSLYQLVRARQCPYFYLCAPTFTVLFRAAGISGVSEMNAMLTPTTRGLRQALLAEGIDFSMPLRQGKKLDSFSGDLTTDNCSQMSSTSDESIVPSDSGFLENGEKDNSASDDEEPGMWLESLGLSQSDFPSLNPKKIKLDKEGGKSVDHQPQSIVYIQGSETQAFFNFLLNTKLCFAKTGPLVGVPPTLISPTAFHGGSLQSLKVRQGCVKYNNQSQHVIELSGPILPTTVRRLCSLFGFIQDGDYTALLITHKPTISFCSVVPPSQATALSVFAIENLKDCGQSEETVQWMCTNMDKTSIGEIISKNGLYTYS